MKDSVAHTSLLALIVMVSGSFFMLLLIGLGAIALPTAAIVAVCSPIPAAATCFTAFILKPWFGGRSSDSYGQSGCSVE
jgi:hypothetical protein